MPTKTKIRTFLLAVVLSPLLLSGCITAPVDDSQNHNADPFEGFNRGVYMLNDDIDKAVVKPVAELYDKLLPDFFSTSISNFFSNIDDVVVTINDVLQFKMVQAASDASRFVLNTTIGLFGFFDVASNAGFLKHNEDFGQTLGYWGIPKGPYLVVPLLGASNFRDLTGLLVDRNFDPRLYTQVVSHRNLLYGSTNFVDIIDTRAGLLSAEKVLHTAATDPYLFVRNAFLQRRDALVNDGKIPEGEAISNDELFDDL
jgi:phospholipid-binding lipoprotein MlaA